MASIFVRKPKLGDYVCRRLSDRKEFYLDWQNPATPLTETFEYEDETYEIFANAVPCKEGVLHVWKETASRTWCDRYSHKLSGYTLDGTDRAGTISIRENSSSSVNTDFVVSYNATTLDGLASQLNAFFSNTEIFTSQDWQAKVVGEEIHIDHAYTFWQQANYNTGKSGFSLAGNTLPDVTSLANIRRKHGGKGGEGVISSWCRALEYFREDNSSTTYNPNTDVTDIKRGYPLCLPAYLGTSQHQSDHCALLRSVYGEGEEGWLKFMESCLPVYPTDFGNMGQDFGKEMTALLAAKRYDSPSKTDEVLCKAAHYAYERESQTVSKGEFYLPTVRELTILLRHIKYGTISNHNADALNAARYKMGWGLISNGFYFWSCCRHPDGYAWSAAGGGGFISCGGFCTSYTAVPVSLHRRKA